MSVYTCAQVNKILGKEQFLNSDNTRIIFLTPAAFDGMGVYAVLDNTIKYLPIVHNKLLVMNNGYHIYTGYTIPHLTKEILKKAQEKVPLDIWNEKPDIWFILETKYIDRINVYDSKLGHFYDKTSNKLFLCLYNNTVPFSKAEKAIEYLFKQITKLEQENKELNKRVEALELHIKYAPDGEGYHLAQQSFESIRDATE